MLELEKKNVFVLKSLETPPNLFFYRKRGGGGLLKI